MRPLMQAEGLSLTEAYQRVCRDVPLRRPASPEEIARASQFLCSPQARHHQRRYAGRRRRSQYRRCSHSGVCLTPYSVQEPL